MYVLFFWCNMIMAQNISHTFRDMPLPDVLKAINNASERYRIFFIYDELEDFTVTADIKDKSIPDAVREVIGFYPMAVTYSDSIISVECVRKEQTKLIGRVVDNNGEAVAFANIALLSPEDSSCIVGGVSNANGDFVIPCEKRRVLAKVSFVGYKTKYISCNVGEIGTIRLVPDAIMLNGVTVKGNMPKTWLKHDAMVTSVAGTVLEKAGTVEDLLATIPMVDTSNGHVEVFGRGEAEIYVNGRKVQDNTELQQMVSENVQNVEVVNNPGVRYSASTKAVIRIKTRRPQGEGFGFTETAELVYDRGWNNLKEQIDMNYRHGGLDISGRVTGKTATDKTDFANVIDTYLANHWHQEARSKVNDNMKNLQTMVQANYIVNDSNSFGARYGFTRTPHHERYGIFSSVLSQDGEDIERNESEIVYGEQRGNHSLNVYYNGKVGKWELDFNADGLWNKMTGHTASDENTWSGAENGIRDVRTENINRNTLLATRLVAGHPFAGGMMYIGGEASVNTSNNGHTDESGFTKNDESKIRESIFSGFAEYRRRIAFIDAVAGLRYEHVKSDYYLYGVFQREQSRRYSDLFPSLSLSAKTGKVYMQLSYSNDIRRPAYSDLSSAVTYINRYTYEGGNPYLRSTYTRNVVLNMSYSFWLMSAGYKHVKDDRMAILRPYENNPSIAYSYPDNIGAYGQFFLALNASPSIHNVWYPKVTAMLQFQDLIAETPWGNVRFDRPQLIVKWNNMVMLPWKLRLDVKFNFITCGDNTVNRVQRYFLDTSVSIRRDFLKDKLSLQIKAIDPFQTIRNEGEIYSASHVFRYINNDAHCRISLRAVYKFNAARDKYKGKGAGNAEKNRL